MGLYFHSLSLQAIVHRAARAIFFKKENQIILLPLTSTLWCLLPITGLKSDVLTIPPGPYLIWPLPSSSTPPSSLSHLRTLLWSHCLFLLFEHPYLISSPVALCLFSPLTGILLSQIFVELTLSFPFCLCQIATPQRELPWHPTHPQFSTFLPPFLPSWNCILAYQCISCLWRAP